MRTTRQYGETRCVTCQNGWKIYGTSSGRKSSSIQGHTREFLKKCYRVSTVFFTHFSKDRNWDICMRTKITRALWRRRTGDTAPRAENFGDLITADHKVLSEGCESRNNHWYAVVVQDMATRMDSTMPVQNKNFSWNRKEVTKVLGADEETESHLLCQFPRIWQSLWRPIQESLYVDITQIGNTWACWESSTQNQGRDFCSIAAIWSGWKVVGGFHGMLLLSAKHSRPLVWWENTLSTAVRWTFLMDQ